MANRWGIAPVARVCSLLGHCQCLPSRDSGKHWIRWQERESRHRMAPAHLCWGLGGRPEGKRGCPLTALRDQTAHAWSRREARGDLGLRHFRPSCTHADFPYLRLRCEESWALSSPLRQGDRAREGVGGGSLPHCSCGRGSRNPACRKPGIILAGIPGPAGALSHRRGQGGEWTGDPKFVPSRKKGLFLRSAFELQQKRQGWCGQRAGQQGAGSPLGWLRAVKVSLSRGLAPGRPRGYLGALPAGRETSKESWNAVRPEHAGHPPHTPASPDLGVVSTLTSASRVNSSAPGDGRLISCLLWGSPTVPPSGPWPRPTPKGYLLGLSLSPCFIKSVPRLHPLHFCDNIGMTSGKTGQEEGK